MAEAPTTLRVHEWLAVGLLICVVAGLAIITSFEKQSTQPSHALMKTLAHHKAGVEVLVKGAVEYPGIYHLPSDMILQEFLELVQVHPEADLRRYHLDRPVRKGRLNIPVRAMVTVHLKGAVIKEGPIQLLKGSTWKDLLNQAHFSENADTRLLNKKRRLKEGEVINIPIKKHKQD